MLGVAWVVGPVLVPLVGVAVFAVGEVVSMVEDSDDCVVLTDELITSSVEGELLLLELPPVLSLAPPPPEPPLESAPQDSGSVGTSIRSRLSPAQNAPIECSTGMTIRQFLKQQIPAFTG